MLGLFPLLSCCLAGSECDVTILPSLVVRLLPEVPPLDFSIPFILFSQRDDLTLLFSRQMEENNKFRRREA